MYLFFKRFFDFIFAFCLLVLLSPLLLVTAIYIKITSSGPIFFKQVRMGKNMRLFTIYKFRTMTDVPRTSHKERYFDCYNPEIIRGGTFLRRIKIDEIPQLINILKGDMSLIGPRPCLPTPVEKFDENGLRRFEVTPGCTGLAQVNGNIYVSWQQRWRYDAEYVKKLSFLLDLKILLKTFAIICCGEEKFVHNQSENKE